MVAFLPFVAISSLNFFNWIRYNFFRRSPYKDRLNKKSQFVPAVTPRLKATAATAYLSSILSQCHDNRAGYGDANDNKRNYFFVYT